MELWKIIQTVLVIGLVIVVVIAATKCFEDDSNLYN